MTRYLGLAKFSSDLSLSDGRWGFSVEAIPLLSPSVANVTAQLSWRLPFGRISPYLLLQYHYGYDESLRDCMTVGGPSIRDDGTVPYDRADPAMPRSMLRFGIMLK